MVSKNLNRIKVMLAERNQTNNGGLNRLAKILLESRSGRQVHPCLHLITKKD